jgi:hypothetical protein
MSTEPSSIESTTTVEDDDLDFIGYICDLNEGTLLERYTRSVLYLARSVARTKGSGYLFLPVMIANDIDDEAEVTLPKTIAGYRVRIVVENKCLFVTELTAGDPHGAGVVKIVSQTATWNANCIWAICSDSKNTVGGGPNKGSSPDLVIAIPSHFAAAGQNLGRVGKYYSIKLFPS